MDELEKRVDMYTIKKKSIYIHETLENTKWLIYPDNKIFQGWEMFMIIVLLISIFVSPLEISFTEAPLKGYSAQNIFDFVFDILFFLDMALTFNVAVLDS